MPYPTPFVNAVAHYQRLKPEIDAAIFGCLEKGDLIYRQQLHDFEQHLAAFVGTKFAVGLNSGYHALEFSLRAAGIGPGDEVITVAHTFVATISAIVNCGATPVLIDVGADHNMDPSAIEAALTPRTRAIIAVHLNGRMANMDAIASIASRHRLPVIEDACQSLGAKLSGRNAGSIGLTGCWSFYPFKILGGFGDGGAITTNDPDVARQASLLRFNGEDRESGEYFYHGYTALLDNVQAAVLDVKLRHLPSWIEHRRSIARAYHDGLAGIRQITLPAFDGGAYHDVFQNYVIEAESRDQLRSDLRTAGVETLVHWPKPVWEHPGLKLGTLHLPRTAHLSASVVSLPMSAETTSEHVQAVCSAIRTFYTR